MGRIKSITIICLSDCLPALTCLSVLFFSLPSLFFHPLLLCHYIVLTGPFISIFSTSTQSAAGLKALKPAANMSATILNVQIITLLFTFTAQKYSYPPVSKVRAGSFSCFRNPLKSGMDYRIFNVRT